MIPNLDAHIHGDHDTMPSRDEDRPDRKALKARMRARAFHPIHNPDGDTCINFHTGMYQEG